MPGQTLRIERRFAAPRERVFAAFTEVEVMSRWFNPGPEWATLAVEIDPRAGGALRIVIRDPEGTEVPGSGRYTEFEPPRRLAYSWGWEPDGWESLIEIEFEEDGDATLVRVIESGFPNAAERESHEGGWPGFLDGLERELAGGASAT